jgi:hypothetical protein
LFDETSNFLDLSIECRAFIRQDGAGDDRAGYTTSTTKSNFGGNEYIGDILVLTKERKMKKNLERFSVSSHDDDVRDTAVQSLGGLVGTFLELLVVGCALDKVHESYGELRISEGVGLGV